MKQKPTSREGHEHIKPHKESHKERILNALREMKVGGTHEEISDKCGLRPDQVWKRLSECVADQNIFDTGITRELKSGVHGIVWQIYTTKPSDKQFTPTENLHALFNGEQGNLF